MLFDGVIAPLGCFSMLIDGVGNCNLLLFFPYY